MPAALTSLQNCGVEEERSVGHRALRFEKISSSNLNGSKRDVDFMFKALHLY